MKMKRKLIKMKFFIFAFVVIIKIIVLIFENFNRGFLLQEDTWVKRLN